METGCIVTVTEQDISDGLSSLNDVRCYACPVARALQRATGDEEAHVAEWEWALYLCVFGRWHPAPESVREFVRVFDGKRRLLAPFGFRLPPLDDQGWLDECCRCQGLFGQSELDEEGRCPDCR